MSLENLFQKIEAGTIPDQAEFRILLQDPSVSVRADGCHRILKALLKLKTPEAIRLTDIFARRTWELSGYSESVLTDVISAFTQTDQIEMVRQVYKQIGLRFADESDIARSLHFFDLWQNAYGTVQSLDRFVYDRDVLNAINRIASPFRKFPENDWNPPRGRSIKIAHLVRDVSAAGAVLVKIQISLVQNRDRSKFDVLICIPEPRQLVESTEDGRENLRLFEAAGCRFVFLEGDLGISEALIYFSGQIHDEKPDILFTSAALASLRHYFICAMQPAPLTVALVQGPHAQFVAPLFDYAISWRPQLIADCPVDCEQVDLNLELNPQKTPVSQAERAGLGLPDNAKVIVVGGRTQKFQDRGFWLAINRVLTENADTHLLAIGVLRSGVKFLDQVLSPQNETRVRFLGWQKDYSKFLSLADVVVDTFPSGGGVVLLDVMALGVPFIGFQNDELKIFDQVEWSAMLGHVKNQSLILPRNQWDIFVQTMGDVIKNPGKYRPIAEENQKYILSVSNNPRQMAERIESIFERLLSECSSIWTRPRNALLAPQSDSPPILRELLYRQSRLENLLESKVRARRVGDRERELELKLQDLRLQRSELVQAQIDVAEHARYFKAKEEELKAGWAQYNLRLAAEERRFSAANFSRRLLSKIRKVFVSQRGI